MGKDIGHALTDTVARYDQIRGGLDGRVIMSFQTLTRRVERVKTLSAAMLSA